MKNLIIPYAQTGLEGARWLRDEAEVGGTIRSHLRNRSFREAGLLAVRNSLQLLPAFDVRKPLGRFVEDHFDVIGAGSEVVVVRSDSSDVHKYITGKTQEPETLAPRLQELDNKARKHLGGYLPPVSVNKVTTKLFKGTSAREYVRLDQPFINILLVDPHLDMNALKNQPEIRESIRDFSHSLMNLFEQDGLLMDIVNKGNLVWGSIGEGEEQLYLLDTIPIDYGEPDFSGISIPFWSPDMHLEYLTDFVNTAHSSEYFTAESAADWLE